MLEVSLACALLSLALLACFQLFLWGTRSFQFAQKRLGLEGEGRLIRSALRQDLMRADGNLARFETARSSTNPEAQLVPRHAYCIPGLLNWNQATSFDTQEAVPRWDCYWIVYATLGAEGRLLKRQVRPAGAPYVSTLAGFPGTFLADPPAADTRALSDHLDAFELAWNDSQKTLRLSFLLAARGGKKGQARQISERHQLAWTVRLENSGP